MNWTPSWEAQEENRSSRSIFILWWWGFNSIPGNSQPLNVSEQSTRHTRDTICLICAAHSAWHVLLPVPGRSPSPITGGRECSRKRRAVWMTDHWTVSNFSCTHKSKGGGGRGAVGAAAGDSEVVLTLWVCPSTPFFGKSKQRSYWARGQDSSNLHSLWEASLWETGAAWGSQAVIVAPHPQLWGFPCVKGKHPGCLPT